MCLPPDHLLFRLLQVVSLGGTATGQGAGSGYIPQHQREAVRRVRGGFRPPFQPGQILSRVRRKGLSLQEIIAREIAPTQPAALTIGRFSAGEAPNIIPEDVILEGTIRAMDCKISKYIFDRIEEISIQTASIFRGQACVKEIASAPPLQNDSEMVKELASYMKGCYEPYKIVLFTQGGMGSEVQCTLRIKCHKLAAKP